MYNPDDTAEIITEEVMIVKKLIICLILALGMCAGALAEPEIQEGICMQVIGETDFPVDQEYKLIVRDWAVEYLNAHMEPAGDPYAQLMRFAGGMEAHLNSLATEYGKPPFIRVDVGAFQYPEKEFEGRSYPAGIYRALRVTIGAGAGRNWWCMLYPGEYESSDTTYYSAIVNWLLDLLDVH